MAKRFISVFISTCIALLSPGLGLYDALAQVVGQSVGASANAPMALPASFAAAPLGAGSFIGMRGPSALQVGSVLPGAAAPAPSVSFQLTPSAGFLRPQAAVPAAAAVSPAASAVSPAAARAVAQAAVLPARTTPPAQEASFIRTSAGRAAHAQAASAEAARPGTLPQDSGVRSLDKTSRDAADALRAFQELPMDSMEGSAGVGERLERALTGEQGARADDAPQPVPAPWLDEGFGASRSGLMQPGGATAEPAGKQSIEAAVRTYDGPPVEGTGSSLSKLWDSAARVLGAAYKGSLAALASGAAILLSAPLFWSGSVLAGSLLLASGLGLAALPLLSPAAPKLVKPLPGAAFAGLGVALASLSPTLGGALTAALAGFAAFALVRHIFADGQAPHRGGKTLAAWLGGMGVLLGIGLLLTPAPAMAAFWSGILPASFAAQAPGFLSAARWASLAAAGLLLIHMPEKVRALISRPFGLLSGALTSLLVRAGLAGSPSMRERLKGLTDRLLARSRWNSLWLAPLWLPFLAHDAAAWALSSRGRGTIGRVAAFSLLTLGLGTLAAVPYFLLAAATPAGTALALLQTNAFWLGLAGTLGGWGLVRFTGPKGPAHAPWYETLGVAMAALAAFAGVGTALLGLSGPAAVLLPLGAYAASPLLLRQLPRWLGEGLRASAAGVRYGVARAREVLSAPASGTKFQSNLLRAARSELGRSFRKGAPHAAAYVTISALRLVLESAAALLGLAWGLATAPANFLWGATHEARPESRPARFIAAFSASAARCGIAFRGPAGRWIAAQLPALDEVSPANGAPTSKAWLAFVKAMLAQAAWLLSLAAWTPIAAVLSLVDGVRAAFGSEASGAGSPGDVLR